MLARTSLVFFVFLAQFALAGCGSSASAPDGSGGGAGDSGSGGREGSDGSGGRGDDGDGGDGGDDGSGGTPGGEPGTTGTIDTTFGEDGVARLLPQSYLFTPTTGIVLRDDRVVVAGRGSDEIGRYDVVIGRFTADGQPDTPIGEFGAGNASIKYSRGGSPGDLTPVGVKETEDGLLYYYGTSVHAGSFFSAFVEAHDVDTGRCDPFDDAENLNDLVCWRTPNPTYTSLHPLGFLDVAFDDDGSLYAGGSGPANSIDADFALMKLASDGHAVTDGFGDLGGFYGFVETDLGGTENEGISLVSVEPNGGVLVVGGTTNTEAPGLAMVRYDDVGVIDEDFGNEGIALLGVPTQRLVELEDGSFLGVYANPVGPTTSFVHALRDGTLDPDFGENGQVRAAYAASGAAIAALFVAEDGKIYVGYEDFTVGRFSADGELDTTWNATGFATVPEAARGESAWLTGLGQQTSGAIVAFGGQGKAGNQDRYMVAVRFVR